MTPTTTPLPTQAVINDDIVDSFLTLNAVAGFLIYLIDDFERKHQKQFKFEFKKTGNAFRNELLKSVNQVWIWGDQFDEQEVGQQQADTYLLAERAFHIALEASRKLSGDDLTKFEMSFRNLASSFRLELPKG